MITDIYIDAYLCSIYAAARAIKDLNRRLKSERTYDSPREAIESTAEWYARDWWEKQPYYVEVMSEKEALINDVCERWQVPYTIVHGYNSTTAAYDAGKRFRTKIDNGRQVLVLYVGDFDPSGLQMQEDLEERINLVAGSTGSIEVKRLGLTREQVRQYRLPGQKVKLPAEKKEGDGRLKKGEDSRAAKYVKQHGKLCWEVDALPPELIPNFIEQAVEAVIDNKKLGHAQTMQEREKKRLLKLANEWK
jgi:hypothetical protein